MSHRELVKRRLSVAAVVAVTLLVLGAGLCCLDSHQGGMGDDAMPLGLCFLGLAVLTVILLLRRPLLRGSVVSFGLPAFAAVPLPVPKPPPRSFSLA